MGQSHRQLFVAFLSALLLTASAVAADSTLTRRSAIGGDQRLVSPGDTFQLGLFPVANGTKWYLGIWFTVSPAAVVWVANRDRPLNASSSGILAFSGRGDLVLLDAARNNETVWSSNSSSSAPTAAVAQLRDNGNLVLADAAGAVVWQSFEHPTNTFVAEMRSGKDLKTGALWALSSWRGADDPSPGDFRYVMDTSSLSPELHVWSKGRKTYRTGPWNGVRFSGIPEMTAFEDMFEFRFTNTADEVSYVYRDRVGSPASRVVLNESGVMQRMVWDRAAGAWNVFWSGPRDQCDHYGLCGAFGVCNVVDAVVCGCVRGFRPRSPAEWRMRNASGGCARSTQLQCEGGGEDGFYALHGVKLPETRGSSVDAGASLDECRRRCLSNCSCTAYAASDIRDGGGGSGCIQWFGELMDTRFVDGGQDLFVRLALSDLETAKSKKFLTVIAAVIAGFALLLLSLSFLIWRKVQRRRMEVAMFGDIMRGECPTYHLETIRTATDGFRPENEIGRGGFGIVYKSELLYRQTILWYSRPDPNKDNLVIHASCDGLLIISFLDEGLFEVCNPITRQRAPLPLLCEDSLQITKTRIVGFYQHKPCGGYHVLYSISTMNEDLFTFTVDFYIVEVGTNEARTIKQSPLQQEMMDKLIVSYNASVLYHDNLHWVLKRHYSSYSSSNIMVFDTMVETFRWMCRPPGQYPWMSLLELHGVLSMCNSYDGIVLDIYVMHDYKAEVWAFMYRIDLMALKASPPLSLRARTLRRIAILNEYEMLIEFPGCVLHCDIGGKFLGKMECSEGEDNRMRITPFRFQENICQLPFFGMKEDYGAWRMLEEEGDDEKYYSIWP